MLALPFKCPGESPDDSSTMAHAQLLVVAQQHYVGAVVVVLLLSADGDTCHKCLQPNIDPP